MEKLYVSEEGLQKLKEDLRAAKERRMHVADAIERARALGDLKENAEYHAAKEEQAMLHARMRDLEHKIASSQILNNDDFDTDKAYIGSTVRVLNEKTGRELAYTLVSPVEMDIDQGKISVRSPIGQALLGKAVGERVVAKVPAGELRLEIVEITR